MFTKLYIISHLLLIALWSGDWSSPQALSTEAIFTSELQLTFDTSINSLGKGFSIWSNSDATSTFVSKYNGTLWSDEEAIATGQVVAVATSIELNDRGNAIACWQRGNFSAREVVAASYDGLIWSGITTLSEGGVDSFDPAIAFSSTGADGLVVWEASDNPNIQIFFSSFHDNWTSYDRISDINVQAINPSVAINADGNGMAVWLDITGHFIQANHYDGGLWDGPKNITSYSSIDPLSRPSVAMSDSGQAVAAWNDTGLIRASIFTGTSWGGFVPLSANGNHVKAAINSENSAVVTWTDTTTNRINASIYSSGSWSDATPISSASSNADWPQAQILDTGGVVIVWADSDSGTLYSSRYDGSNWSTPATIRNQLVNTDTGAAFSLGSSGVGATLWPRNADDFATASIFTHINTFPPRAPSITHEKNDLTLKWNEANGGNNIAYRVYQGSRLLSTVTAQNTFQYIFPSPSYKAPVTYSIRSVSPFNQESSSVTISTHNYKN